MKSTRSANLPFLRCRVHIRFSIVVRDERKVARRCCYIIRLSPGTEEPVPQQVSRGRDAPRRSRFPRSYLHISGASPASSSCSAASATSAAQTRRDLAYFARSRFAYVSVPRAGDTSRETIPELPRFRAAISRLIYRLVARATAPARRLPARRWSSRISRDPDRDRVNLYANFSGTSSEIRLSAGMLLINSRWLNEADSGRSILSDRFL